MKKFYLILSSLLILLIISCTNKGLIETDQKKIYLSNTKMLYDVDKKMFRFDFSINNNSKEALSNFAYIIVFKDKDGNAITSIEEFYKGVVEKNKAERTSIYIDDYTRSNFDTYEIEIKK
jgi:hypothetical protein